MLNTANTAPGLHGAQNHTVSFYGCKFGAASFRTSSPAKMFRFHSAFGSKTSTLVKFSVSDAEKAVPCNDLRQPNWSRMPLRTKSPFSVFRGQQSLPVVSFLQDCFFLVLECFCLNLIAEELLQSFCCFESIQPLQQRCFCAFIVHENCSRKMYFNRGVCLCHLQTTRIDARVLK